MPIDQRDRAAYYAGYKRRPAVRARERARPRKKDPVGHKARNKRYVERNATEPKFRAYRLWSDAKKRAGRAGIVFTLPRGWVEERLLAGFCEKTSLPFDLSGSKRAGCRVNAFAPSIDKIDASKGYTEDNCAVVVAMYNFAKGQWGEQALRTLVDALAKRH